MDQQSFDRIARLLGGAVTRRAGVRAVLGGLLGLAAVDTAEAKRGGGRKKGRPGVEGPCGDGSRKDNVCTKDKQCCTGYCKKGMKNKDGKGRCRCAPKDYPCTKKTVCCKRFSCIDGICQKPSSCDVCPNGCPYATVEAAWAATPDGGTIAIGAGTYPTAITVDKSMTVTACTGVDAADVVLIYKPDSGLQGVFEDGDVADHTLNLIGVTIDSTGSDTYGGVYGKSHLTVNADGCGFQNGGSGIYIYTGAPDPVTVTNCTFSDFRFAAVEIRAPETTVTNCTVTSDVAFSNGLDADGTTATITDCTVSLGGGGRAVHTSCSGTATVSRITATGGGFWLVSPDGRVSDCTITDAPGFRGAGLLVGDGAYTLERTTISGCTASLFGGGICARSDFGPISLTLLDGVVVTGNTAPEGSGIATYTIGPAITITGATTSKVYGNITGDQCESTTDGSTWVPQPSCWP